VATWISELGVASVRFHVTVLPEWPRLVVPNFENRHDKELNREINHQNHGLDLVWIEDHIDSKIDDLKRAAANMGVHMPKAPFCTGDVLLQFWNFLEGPLEKWDFVVVLGQEKG